MKSIVTVVVGVLALLIGIFGTYTWLHDREEKLRLELQQLQDKDKQCQERLVALTQATKWEALEPGARVLRLWQVGGPDRPQFAVVELSNEKYKSLKENPSEFINQLKIFPKPVQKGARCIEMAPPPSNDYRGPWYVMLGHKTPSTCQCSAFDGEDQVPPQP